MLLLITHSTNKHHQRTCIPVFTQEEAEKSRWADVPAWKRAVQEKREIQRYTSFKYANLFDAQEDFTVGSPSLNQWLRLVSAYHSHTSDSVDYSCFLCPFPQLPIGSASLLVAHEYHWLLAVISLPDLGQHNSAGYWAWRVWWWSRWSAMCNETEAAVCSCTHNMDSIHPWIYI